MLSIVIPTFNEEAWLTPLLASIRSQSFKDYEIIVADNHSTDRTREIALAFGARVVDGGDHPGKGRNRGAEVAKGDMMLFLDADVVIPDTTWLEKKMSQFARRHLDIGTCLVKPIGGKGVDKVVHAVYSAHMLTMQYVHEHAPGFCIFVKKRLHDGIGGFDEEVRLAEDHDYVRRAADHGKFRVLIGKPINVSVRRFERDGRLNIIGKYLLVEAYNLIHGAIKNDSFKYTFGHDKPKDSAR